MTKDRPEPAPAEPSEARPVFVARQPVFDTDGNIWGYELLYRHSSEVNRAEISDPDQATLAIIADGISLATQDRCRMDPAACLPRLLVNFPESLLLSETVFALPVERCVVEVLETVEPTEEVLSALKRIKAEGYVIALDDYTGEERFQALLDLVDIVKVDVLDMDDDTLRSVSQSLRDLNAGLLAEKVESEERFVLARELGFSYFQGFHFEQAEIVSSRKISIHLLPRLQLIQALSRDDFDTNDVVSILSSDTGLTYRLLRFINSAFFALANPIRNVRQAVTLLGARQLRQWLLAVAMTDTEASPARQASMETGLLRARFLQLLAEQCGQDPDTLFLLGLFSKLDELFGVPLEELMEQIPLEEAIKQALLKEAGDLGLWLRLARQVEQGSWEETGDILKARNISVKAAALAHNAATTWTIRTIASLGEPAGA